jgi:FkbM family methyltransferase
MSKKGFLATLRKRLLGDGEDPLKRSLKREPLFLEMLGRGLGDGPITMISIGSSDGGECLYALERKGRDVTVHLLEPDPGNMEICRRNIGREKTSATQVHFHPLAVSDRVVSGQFFRNPDAPHLNSASAAGGACEAMDVSYTTLDHFMAQEQIHAPVIVNMDIEGHEVEALEGFLQFASANQGVKILMEVHPGLYTEERSFERVLSKYFELGFRTTYLESAGVPVPEKFKEFSLSPVQVIKHRALYEDLDAAFVLDAACHEHVNPVDETGRVSRKIVRSILIERRI